MSENEKNKEETKQESTETTGTEPVAEVGETTGNETPKGE